MSIRMVRLFTGDDGQSHFDVGAVSWMETVGQNAVSGQHAAQHVTFEETPAGSHLDWHHAPCRQYVVTLSGTLEFETRGGAKEIIRPGDILLAEDTAGGGHRWRLIDENPWRRMYVKLT